MQFSMLGACEASGAGRSLRGPLQRLLLALLIRAEGEWVAADTLADALWPDHPDERVSSRLHVHVHRLRSALGDPGRIEAGPGGYRLVAATDEVDVWRFEALVARATDDLSLPSSERLTLLNEALGLWRGPAYPGLDHWVLVAEADRLGQRRLAAVEERCRLEVDRGGHVRVLDELAEIARAYPLRERLRALWMTALHRAGRQAEALEVYAATRQALVEELGIEPGAELRGLQALVLAGDDSATPPGVLPEQLPAPPRPFHARGTELARLDALLSDAAEDSVPGLLVITGAGGTGKTSLALQWAHQHRDRFSDGQLHVDLRGHGIAEPLEPDEVLRRFLSALGDHAGPMPEGEDALAARFRSLVSRRRLLIMLDDAGSVEQVRPLVPAGGHALVLVTSRDPLTGLMVREGAHTLALERFDRVDAIDFLHVLLDGQVACTDAEAELIAGHCGRLPLALRVVAEEARATSGRHPLSRLIEDLADERRRLGVLGRHGDRESDVRTVLSWSLHGRSAPARRLFSWFGLLPTSATAASVAVFAGLSAREVEEPLAELVRAHLVEAVAPAGGPGDDVDGRGPDADDRVRFTQHDLLRAFAREQADDELEARDRDAGWDRLLGQLVVTVAAASQRLEAGRWDRGPDHLPAVRPRRFADEDQARRWLADERSLALAAALAAGPAGAPYRPQLAEWLTGHLARHGDLCEMLPLHRAAEADLSDESDLHLRARTERAHAIVLGGVGLLEDATSYAEQALAHYRQAEDPVGTATLLNHVARAKSLNGAWRQSAALLTEGLALIEPVEGATRGRGMSLAQLGHARLMLGELDLARDALVQARALDLTGQPTVHLHLQRLHSRLARWEGRHDEALDLAADGVREAAERAMVGLQAMLLVELAAAQRRVGRLSHARATYQEGASLTHHFGLLHISAIAGDGLARVWLQSGEPGRAIAHGREALATSRAAGAVEGRGRILARLGDAWEAAGGHEEARGYRFEALRCFESTDEVLPDGKLDRLRELAHVCPVEQAG